MVWCDGFLLYLLQSTLKVAKSFIIANDITDKIGSFGPLEDQIFYLHENKHDDRDELCSYHDLFSFNYLHVFQFNDFHDTRY